MRAFKDPTVAAKFKSYPPNVRRRLLDLRGLIFETAARIDGIGELEESLKWGEAAYRPASPGIGTTVRIDWKPNRPAEYALYVHCQTTLVDRFRRTFPRELKFEGNRAIVMALSTPMPRRALAWCIGAALTYGRKRVRPR